MRTVTNVVHTLAIEESNDSFQSLYYKFINVHQYAVKHLLGDNNKP